MKAEERAKQIPQEDGYYWVRMFHHNHEPQIVFVGQWTGVLVIGSRERYSDYYDVVEWLGKVSDFKA